MSPQGAVDDVRDGSLASQVNEELRAMAEAEGLSMALAYDGLIFEPMATGPADADECRLCEPCEPVGY